MKARQETIQRKAMMSTMTRRRTELPFYPWRLPALSQSERSLVGSAPLQLLITPEATAEFSRVSCDSLIG